MSTTIQYKGNTLATVSNNTKTLKTAGKYMEGDVVLTDSSLAPPAIQSLSITPSESAQTFNASGVDGYKPVSVSAVSSTYVGSGIDRRGGSDITIGITTTYDINYKKGYYDNNGSKSILFNTLSNPSISIDSTGLITSSLTLGTSGPYKAQTVTATEQLTLRDSDDLTVSGATVTTPAGYYAEAASKSVTTMTLPTGYKTSPTSGYTAIQTWAISSVDRYINIDPGYLESGGYYKINGVPNGSATGPSSLSGSSATITTGTNTITLTKTGITTTPTVSAGYVSSATASTATVTLTASVTVNPTPTASGATVTIPAGYYSSQTTKSVSSGSASAPTSISGTSATVSTGTNTLTLTKTVSVTPVVSAGYVSSGTATNSSVTLTASVTTKAAATITPGTTNQTIASGTYLTGTQTIAGDADLVASNIVSGVQIFGVTGNVILQHYYTGSSAPSSSTGSNGDLYLQS